MVVMGVMPLRLLALLLATALLARGAAAVTPSAVKSGAANEDDDSVHFFNVGADALSWNTDELAHVRNLHGVSFKDEKEYLAAGNLANYLGLSPIASIHMAVPLSIVFIGFSGDGNLHVNVPEAELQEWFGQLDHVLPHTRVELSELTCSEDGHCAGLVHGRFRPTPMHSYVNLNFTCQVVVVKKAAVIETFERAIHAFSRPVDPLKEAGPHQVDAFKMEQFVTNFLSHLGLEESYSLVVVNPAWAVEDPKYGYRLGFSTAEIEYLQGQPASRVKLVAAGTGKTEPPVPVDAATDVNSRRRGWYKAETTAPKFGVVNETVVSSKWVHLMSTYLSEEETLRRDMLELAGKEPGAAAVVQAARVLHMRPRTTAADILEEELLEEPTPDRSVHSRFSTLHPAEDCLVGNWVGRGRWLMVDLTAGAGDWGPATGGQGVVNEHTLPAVHDYFGALSKIRKDIRESLLAGNETERMLEHMLHSEKIQRIGSATRHHAHVHAMERNRKEADAKAPGAKASTASDAEVEAAASAKWERKYKEVIAQSELAVYESFSQRYCKDVMPVPLVCIQMKEDFQKLRNQASKMASTTGGSYDFNGTWGLFGDDPNWEAEYSEVADEASRSRGLFMAELSAVLSRAIRHVIAPPSAVWRRDRLQEHDVATHFTEQVNFQIFVISDGSHKTWTDSPHTKTSAFDLEAYKEQVMRLKLYHQEFKFTTTNLILLQEPALAVAFAASLKTAAHAIPAMDGSLDETEQVYLDSEELSHFLRQQFDSHITRARTEHGSAEEHAKRQRQVQEVPIFVFQIDRDEAILIDEHYNARSMENLVLVVHNSARYDEHPSGMMCGGTLVARPLNPLRAALGATLMLLGGVLPPHLGYSPASQRVTHDWLWSVGDHPLSFTSAGAHFSQMQIDALGRSYLLDALDTSVELVNRGILALRSRSTAAPPLPGPDAGVQTGVGGLLQKARAALKAARLASGERGEGKSKKVKAPVIPKAQLVALLEKYSMIVAQWRSFLAMAYQLEWSADSMAYLEEDAAGFLVLARQAAGLAPPSAHERKAARVTVAQCGGASQVVDPSQTALDKVMVVSLGVAGLALLYAVWPVLRKMKPRLN